jgi:hypothetical protein
MADMQCCICANNADFAPGAAFGPRNTWEPVTPGRAWLRNELVGACPDLSATEVASTQAFGMLKFCNMTCGPDDDVKKPIEVLWPRGMFLATGGVRPVEWWALR